MTSVLSPSPLFVRSLLVALTAMFVFAAHLLLQLLGLAVVTPGRLTSWAYFAPAAMPEPSLPMIPIAINSITVIDVAAVAAVTLYAAWLAFRISKFSFVPAILGHGFVLGGLTSFACDRLLYGANLAFVHVLSDLSATGSLFALNVPTVALSVGLVLLGVEIVRRSLELACGHRLPRLPARR